LAALKNCGIEFIEFAIKRSDEGHRNVVQGLHFAVKTDI